MIRAFRDCYKIFVLVFLSACGYRNDYVDFDTFRNSTSLTLEGYFHDNTDCGEWGGHKEIIVVTRNQGKLVVSYQRDSSQCIRKSFVAKKQETEMITKFQGELTREKQRFILDYINELYAYVPEKYSMSNAIDYYELVLKENYTTQIFRIDYAGNDWTAFEKLRNKIIDKSPGTPF